MYFHNFCSATRQRKVQRSSVIQGVAGVLTKEHQLHLDLGRVTSLSTWLRADGWSVLARP